MKTKYPLLTVRGRIDYATLDSADNFLEDMQGDTIYMLIESGGGDPAVGYRVMRLLEAKYKRIVAVVPAAAYSTATLMVLGADEIYMRKSACLGPLDTQIEHPSDGSTVSSLEIRDSLSGLAGALSSYAEGFFESLKNEMKLSKKDAAEIAMKTAADLVQPVASSLDPIYLQIGRRSTMAGQKYAEELLTSRMMKMRPALASLVSKYLANRYYYHGYAITLNEASELLALNVKDVTDLPEWDEIKSLYKAHKEGEDFGVYLDEITVDDGKPDPKKIAASPQSASATIVTSGKVNKGTQK
jgi:ClpP class serine protease